MAGQGPNMEQFEVYFQRADLDRDGRISGAEAVAFLQGSNLPKQVLAQVWMHADQTHSGFLSRGEFYNALKLVTVAQSKRELTPDIVKAALFGPASIKIPAPQINLAAIPAPRSNSVGAAPAPQSNSFGAAPAPQSNSFGAAPAPKSNSFGAAPAPQSNSFGAAPAPQMRTVGPQMGAVTPTVTQHPGFRGQAPQSQQYLPSQGSHLMRPPLAVASSGAVRPQHGVAGLDFPRGGAVTSGPPALHGVAGGTTSGATTPTPNRGITPNTLVASRSLDSLSTIVSNRNENASDSMFGGEAFSVSQTLPRQGSGPPFSTSSAPASTALVPVTSGSQSSAKPDPFEALQSTFTRPSSGSQQQLTQSTPKTSQQHSAQTITPLPSSGIPAVAVNSTAEQPQASWPKMTRAGVQKYAKVFMEVDTDRDGRITGEQARNLFLSWRLPREVLKQVWDLADQDTDSMLSLREFCIALYLMERYREGRSIPPTLPNSVLLDETLISLAGPPTVSYGTAGWGQTPGMRPHQVLPGTQPNSHAGVRPQMQAAASQPDGSMQFNQQNTRSLSMENSNLNQLSNGDQNILESKGEEEGDKKVEDKEKVILDSREKLEYYRTKMQDLVLYKSRCDNRLNEITERALADKREAELLQKKYEEKYKQVAEIASKLTIEEAAFRDVQERKLELQQAIIKMEQGGSADGILQVRADRIQSDLEELLKALMERCKKHGITVKSTALIELPHGWQPGIPEISAVWDEDWDKFEDEGFSFDVTVPATAKSTSHQMENSPTHINSPDSMSNAEAKSEQLFSHGVSALETESTYTHSEDESKSPQGSPAGQRAFQSPTKEFSDDHFGKSFETDAETNRSFDGSGWGTFDNNDDVDSVWGFSAKDSDHDKHGGNYFFGSSDFGGSPARSGSPAAESRYQKNSPFTFEDSVPGSPLSRAGNSPRYSVGSGDPFESFSRYDSFTTHDRTSSPRRETLTRFDSMSSTSGFDHSRGFSFDDSDPFGSSGPFKVSSESQTPKKHTDSWSAF